MLKKILSFFILLLVLSLSSVTFAEDLILEFDADEFIGEAELELIEGAEEEVSSLELTQDGLPTQRDLYLQGYQQLFQLNESEIAGFQALLVPLNEDLSNIDTQLQVLSQQMRRIEQLKGILLQKQLGLHDLASKLRVQQQLLELEIKDVLKKFERLLQLYYSIKRQYIDKDGNLSLLQLFSTADEPADLILQDFLLERVQSQMIQQLQSLSQQQLQLDQLAFSIASVKAQYDLYDLRLGSSAAVLEEQTQYQQELFKDKEKEEHFFALQLEQAREEQQAILVRIQEVARGVTFDDYRGFPKEQMIWPVAPTLGISAEFNDSGYRSRFGLAHNALDIPTDQLTPVKAPMSARVLKVVDSGFGYNYLQLGHSNGLSTVYGHVYSFKVQEGDIVKQGQLIALSGGGIGTKGAGRLTTGPHLHFEVLKDGEHVDPKGYLPKLSL
jgi:murein DD-endopeptidase MepM/ murein hydrolase activator NlpD